ncbi:MAG: hypothetical protein A2X86_19085 [Bdellovibrionales bacterium GWA2_49_15]|nr:MAG: hypothetical protein A2X86_19085 [Bdellovibrionales bacterium GWA2_49_15]HAZ14332.1 hypothetical protein [Bdellovibrionales bacterium]
MKLLLALLLATMMLSAGCGGFKAKRVDAAESDEKAMEITDQWVSGDTEKVVRDILKQIQDHKGFQAFLRKKGSAPKIFIADVQNMTSEAYFPINDINDEMLNEFSSSGDFTLIDAAAREAVLKEITYQNDGMVDPADAKKVGKQTGAELMVFGNVYMKPESRDGKTIKQYNVNIRMTEIEKAVEVLRVRTKLSKFSEQKKTGW